MKSKAVRLVAALAIVTAWLALPASALAKKLDLNTATQKELEELPGVGEATAKKIIAGRPYSSVADLEKAGVPKSTIDKIRSKVTVSKSHAAKSEPAAKPESAGEKPAKTEKAAPAKREAKPAASGLVNINTASEKDLEELPGVGPATARKIVSGRPYASVDDLARAGVPKSTIGKIRSQVTLGAAPPPPAAAASAEPARTRSGSAPAPASVPAQATEVKPAAAAASPRQAPSAKGMVWVNTATRIYHREGDKWYGNTKEGKYMTEEDAIKAGYRASKEGTKKP
jgi:competence protein ComEA